MASRGAVGRTVPTIGKGPIEGFVPYHLPAGAQGSIVDMELAAADARTFAPRIIRGQVTEAGATLLSIKLVMIPHDTDHEAPPRATWSGSDGRYAFRNTRPGRYAITAHHLAGDFRAKTAYVDTEI